MNRDELWTRAAEIPPTIRTHDNGVVWAAPTDSAAGGTWCGVNDRGLVACLLNRYAPEDPMIVDRDPPPPSRGGIVPVVLREGGFDAARRFIEAGFDPSPYASFTVVIAARGENAVYDWSPSVQTLKQRRLAQPWGVTASSGFDVEATLAWRARRFASWQREGGAFVGALPRFHLVEAGDDADGDVAEGEASDDAGDVAGTRSGYAVRVQRAWSGTRSIVQVAVLYEAGEASLGFWSVPREGEVSREPDATVRLALRRPATSANEQALRRG